ncbi:MAG: pyroglutamyl-peptidase I [Arenimonas sp.]|nr:pyroglutamyl-peptidase I [Arenimonas sp.]MBP7916950.1 pyroglutamyl-peptidase I [Arenimonas sp.]
MTVLLTGFEPFAGEPVNPSWLMLEAFDGMLIDGHPVMSRCLPTAFGHSLLALAQFVDTNRPDIVIAFGQAGGRSAISLERVAINCDDARIADNIGKQPIDSRIVAHAQNAYFSTLPIKASMHALHQAGIPAEISNTAGTFVCNHLFYGLMHMASERPGMKAGFVHVPYLPEQAVRHPGVPSMDLPQLQRAVEIIIRCALQFDTDLRLDAGREC